MRRLTALAFALLLAAHAVADEWQTIAPAGLGFSVSLPATADIKEEKVDLGGGRTATMRTLQVRASNATYDVTTADYPKGALKSVGEEQVLDNARDGAIANSLGPLLSEAKIDVEGHPARELTVDMTMDHVSRTRIFTVEDRLYSIGAIVKTADVKAEHIERFFNSFKLSGGGKP